MMGVQKNRRKVHGNITYLAYTYIANLTESDYLDIFNTTIMKMA